MLALNTTQVSDLGPLCPLVYLVLSKDINFICKLEITHILSSSVTQMLSIPFSSIHSSWMENGEKVKALHLGYRGWYPYCKLLCLYFLDQETQRLMQEPVPGISAIPDEKNARYFKVIVAGPEGVSVLTDEPIVIYEPQQEIFNNVACATSKGSDQQAHTRRLIRAFACRSIILWLLSYWSNFIWCF